MATGIIAHFEGLPDPRASSGRAHELSAILTRAICGMVCGADDWSAIAEFGEAKADWFKGFLTLPHGIPSHDTFATFARVFAALDPKSFEQCFFGVG